MRDQVEELKKESSAVIPDFPSEEEEESECTDQSRDSTLERNEDEEIKLSHTEQNDNFEVAGEKVVKDPQKLPDGSTYAGEWLGDKPHGQGKLIFKDQST